MKSLVLGCLTAMTIGIAGASAQAAMDKTPTGAVSPTPSAAAPATPAPKDAAAMKAASAMTDQKDTFITTQQAGMMRAPKLIGVAVYDSENKDIGKISDLLLDHDGSVKAVVISIGGFLGIGSKDVAVPYADIHWQTEQRTVATNPAPGGAPGNAMTGTTTNAKPAEKTVSPAKTEAYRGYPDRAVINMSQAELKAAPDFKYASNPDEVAPRGDSTTAPPAKP